MTTKNTYDPMADFYRQAITFLFKQGIVAAFCIVATWIMWQKMGGMELRYDAKMIVAKSQWSDELREVRSDLKHSIAQKDTIIREYAKIAAKLATIEEWKGRVNRAHKQELRPSFGAKE